MKKACWLSVLAWCCLSAFAQFEVRNVSHVKVLTDTDDGLVGVDYVLLVNGVTASMELAYIAWDGSSRVNWYEYSASDLNPTVPMMGGQTEIPVEAGHGYLLEVDGVRTRLWITEYVPPVISLFEPVIDNDQGCETTIFNVVMDEESNLNYLNGQGVWLTITREFTLEYNTKTYPDGGDDWVTTPIEEADEDGEVTVSFPTEQISTTASLDPTTTFVLSGDRFAIEWGLEPYEFTATSTADIVFPVESYLTCTMTVREALNEISRPSEVNPTSPIKGSAPLEILFESRPSDASGTLYSWAVYKGDDLQLTRTDEDLRYTFQDYGTYEVKLTVYREYVNGLICSMSDSVQVSVSESFLAVPNVFTPNGDGKNDEFRVAYRSLESFHCWVYNSWGKLVYEWSDPAKGWDGRVNGSKNAPTGTYFYIIRAKGTDGEVHNRKGDINLIR